MLPLLQLSEHRLPLSQRLSENHAPKSEEPVAHINSDDQPTLKFGNGYRILCAQKIDVSEEDWELHKELQDVIHSTTNSNNLLTETATNLSNRNADSENFSTSGRETTYVVNKPWLTPQRSSSKASPSSPSSPGLLNLNYRRISQYQKADIDDLTTTFTIDQETGMLQEVVHVGNHWTQHITFSAEMDLYMAELANEFNDLDSHMILLLFQQTLDRHTTQPIFYNKDSAMSVQLVHDNLRYEAGDIRAWENSGKKAYYIMGWEKLMTETTAMAGTFHNFRHHKMLDSSKRADLVHQEYCRRQNQLCRF